jgi:hypothetical protein
MIPEDPDARGESVGARIWRGMRISVTNVVQKTWTRDYTRVEIFYELAEEC